MFIGETEDSASARNTISHGMVAFTIRTEVSNIPSLPLFGDNL